MPPNSQVLPLRTLQIIVLALIGGVAVFAAIAAAIGFGKEPDPGMGQIFLGVLALLGLTEWLAWSFVVRRSSFAARSSHGSRGGARGAPGGERPRRAARRDHPRGRDGRGGRVLGAVAFCFSTAGGVLFAKGLNLFLRRKINPCIGAAGVSAVPMSARVVQQFVSDQTDGRALLCSPGGGGKHPGPDEIGRAFGGDGLAP